MCQDLNQPDSGCKSGDPLAPAVDLGQSGKDLSTGLPANDPWAPAPGNPLPQARPAGVAEEWVETTAFEDGTSDSHYWKAALRAEFETWLATMEDPPEPEDTDEEEPSAPDLGSFFKALTVLSTESRKANRRTAEVLSQWSERLESMQTELGVCREQIAEMTSPEDEGLPRAHCLALIEILDRTLRLAAAFKTVPPRTWWSRDTHWRRAWATQQQGFDILREHLQTLLRDEGIQRIDVIGQPFNPKLMSAVTTQTDDQHPHLTVLEEIAPGYEYQGELLRLAQVKVSLNRPGQIASDKNEGPPPPS